MSTGRSGWRSGGGGAFANQVLPVRFQALSKFFCRRTLGRGARRDNDVDTRQFALSLPEALANQTAQSIARNRRSQHAHADRHAKPRAIQAIRAKCDTEVCVPRPASILVDTIEFRAGTDSLAGSEGQTPDRGSVRESRR